MCQAWPAIGESVTPTTAEFALAKYLSKRRVTRNEGMGWASRKVGNSISEEGAHFRGILGEIGFARMTNSCPDFSDDPRVGGYDLLVDGMAIDVKSREWSDKTDGLMIWAGKGTRDPADVYVLMKVTGLGDSFEPVRVEYMGCAMGSEILSGDRIRDFGLGPTYYMHYTELRGFPLGIEREIR